MKIQRIIRGSIVTLCLAFTAIPALSGTGPVYATAAAAGTCPSSSTAKGQVLNGLSETGSNCDASQVNDTLQTVVNLLSLAVGIAATIVIIISGLKYIISGGESNKVSNAKSSLLYALVGLAIAALTQLLIHFVLFQTTNAP